MSGLPGTPKKGRRFGGDAAHQKAMFGNLVASLIAAEGIVTTEAKAKALRPVVEKSVAGVLIAVLERSLRHTVELTCAGRTDAGVHAWGQVVSFDARADTDPAGLQRSVNKALAPAIVVRRAGLVPAAFDARRSAT